MFGLQLLSLPASGPWVAGLLLGAEEEQIFVAQGCAQA